MGPSFVAVRHEWSVVYLSIAEKLAKQVLQSSVFVLLSFWESLQKHAFHSIFKACSKKEKKRWNDLCHLLQFWPNSTYDWP